MFTPPPNFLFVPQAGVASTGMLYELGEAGSYSVNSVVVIPYQNPQVKLPGALYYKITKKQHVTFPNEPSSKPSQVITLNTHVSKEAYIHTIKELKQHIQAGNIYEINYCLEFFAEDVVINPEAVFFELYRLTRAPYSALLKTGDDYIICASPELFIQKQGHTLLSKPIKGTIRRGGNPQEDEALKAQLFGSIKERTENVMAVDVARNDLSQLASKGSVLVNKLYNIETFETVHQMVSTVSCLLKPNTSFENIIDAAFPMASMTGAPKLRAMQLIDTFERFERNNYSGAMGIIEANGDFALSVIIRSIFYNQTSRRLSIAVGGAITYLSDPEKEYEECLLKAAALLKTLNARIH